MFSKEKLEFEALPLPDRPELTDAEADLRFGHAGAIGTVGGALNDHVAAGFPKGEIGFPHRGGKTRLSGECIGRDEGALHP